MILANVVQGISQSIKLYEEFIINSSSVDFDSKVLKELLQDRDSIANRGANVADARKPPCDKRCSLMVVLRLFDIACYLSTTQGAPTMQERLPMARIIAGTSQRMVCSNLFLDTGFDYPFVYFTVSQAD